MSGNVPANPSRQLFRARALENAAGTEALDVLPLLPRPVDQAGFVLLAILLAVGLGWSIFGTVARTVSGSGILIAQGGQLVEAQSTGAGRITDLAVRPGMAVEAGSVIATVVAADREQRLASAKSLADARRANLQRIRDITESVGQQRTAFHRTIVRAAQEDQHGKPPSGSAPPLISMDIQQALFRRGLATLAKVNEARDAMNTARADQAQAVTRPRRHSGQSRGGGARRRRPDLAEPGGPGCGGTGSGGDRGRDLHRRPRHRPGFWADRRDQGQFRVRGDGRPGDLFRSRPASTVGWNCLHSSRHRRHARCTPE